MQQINVSIVAMGAFVHWFKYGRLKTLALIRQIVSLMRWPYQTVARGVIPPLTLANTLPAEVEINSPPPGSPFISPNVSSPLLAHNSPFASIRSLPLANVFLNLTSLRSNSNMLSLSPLWSYPKVSHERKYVFNSHKTDLNNNTGHRPYLTQ